MLARSILAKVVVLVILVVLLIVPLLAIFVLTAERADRRRTVVQEVTGIWGGRQTVAGPVLSIPFEVVSMTADGKETRRADTLRVLPVTLSVEGRAEVETRRRAIYEVAVYTARLKITGTFRRPDAATLHVPADAMLWEKATICLGGFELRAVLPEFTLTVDARPAAGEPDADTGLWQPGISVPVSGLGEMAAGREIPFEISLPLRGSDTLAFVPVGQRTAVNLTSNWPSPSFTGALLPERRAVSGGGFTAGWRASSLGRNVPQVWRDSDLARTAAIERLDRSGFGASMVTPVDVYTESERATKYGVLFVLLTFLAFFLVEVLQPANVHPVQYILVGAALCLFYLLLLSLAEQIGFTPAYLIAAVATASLIGGYSRYALGTRRSIGQVAVGLAGLYAFLYVLLRLEDYALLVGSVVLFGILSGVMFVTRKVNWYDVGAQKPGGTTQALL
jgi:inner membrane protein